MSESKRVGVVRGCLPIIAIVIVLVGGAVGLLAWRAGGFGAIQREFIVKGSLNLVQQHALDARPDGVSADEINRTFDAMRGAVDKERVDLARMYGVLRDYQERFKATKVTPSNGEMQAFLKSLTACVLSPSDTK